MLSFLYLLFAKTYLLLNHVIVDLNFLEKFYCNLFSEIYSLDLSQSSLLEQLFLVKAGTFSCYLFLFTRSDFSTYLTKKQ